MDDTEHLGRACRLATASASGDGGPFGAVVVCEGSVVGSGTNRVTATGDPTAHAEIEALRAAAVALHRHHLGGCVLYSSCEPCPMCMAAAWWSGVDRIVYAATTADATAAGFADGPLWTAMADRGRAPVPPEHLEHPAAGAPFQAWAANPDRVSY